MSEIRFFLIYGQYREGINYSEEQVRTVINNLRTFKNLVKKIQEKSIGIIPPHTLLLKGGWEDHELKKTFAENMDNDLNVKGAFDGLHKIVSGMKNENMSAGEASGIIQTMKEIDEVFKVVF